MNCPKCGINSYIRYGVLETCFHHAGTAGGEPTFDRAPELPDHQARSIAMVRRLAENSRRMQYSGVWLSVEEVEAVLQAIPTE